jgi:hypothetical protein
MTTPTLITLHRHIGLPVPDGGAAARQSHRPFPRQPITTGFIESNDRLLTPWCRLLFLNSGADRSSP